MLFSPIFRPSLLHRAKGFKILSRSRFLEVYLAIGFKGKGRWAISRKTFQRRRHQFLQRLEQLLDEI